MIIQALTKKAQPRKLTEEEAKVNLTPNVDTIVSHLTTIEKVNEDGSVTKKFATKKINLTKVTNESAKILKAATAQEKLDEIASIFTK